MQVSRKNYALTLLILAAALASLWSPVAANAIPLTVKTTNLKLTGLVAQINTVNWCKTAVNLCNRVPDIGFDPYMTTATDQPYDMRENCDGEATVSWSFNEQGNGRFWGGAEVACAGPPKMNFMRTDLAVVHQSGTQLNTDSGYQDDTNDVVAPTKIENCWCPGQWWISWGIHIQLKSGWHWSNWPDVCTVDDQGFETVSCHLNNNKYIS